MDRPMGKRSGHFPSPFPFLADQVRRIAQHPVAEVFALEPFKPLPHLRERGLRSVIEDLPHFRFKRSSVPSRLLLETLDGRFVHVSYGKLGHDRLLRDTSPFRGMISCLHYECKPVWPLS